MSRVIHLYPQLMKCPYHVSFIQQQTLLASITRANSMLLIWFQETVSRQLNFQLFSYGERMHKTYLYLSCMKAGSDAQIPVSCHGRIKRNVNRSSSLNAASCSLHSENPPLVSLGILTGTRNTCQSTEVQLQEAGVRSSWAGNQRHCCAPSSFLPHAHLLPSTKLSSSSWPFTLLRTRVPGSHLFPPITFNTKSIGRLLNWEASWATTLPRNRVG